MRTYDNKLLPNHFDDCCISISSIHSNSTRLSTSNNLLSPKVNASPGKCSLPFVDPKMGLSMLSCTVLSLLPPLPSKGDETPLTRER